METKKFPFLFLCFSMRMPSRDVTPLFTSVFSPPSPITNYPHLLEYQSSVAVKGARYSLIIHEVLVANQLWSLFYGVFFSAGVQDRGLEQQEGRSTS